MLYLEWLGDELRKIKDDTIRDFVAAGLIKAPNHFGLGLPHHLVNTI